jgi:hypothetical protein
MLNCLVLALLADWMLVIGLSLLSGLPGLVRSAPHSHLIEPIDDPAGTLGVTRMATSSARAPETTSKSLAGDFRGPGCAKNVFLHVWTILPQNGLRREPTTY